MSLIKTEYYLINPGQKICYAGKDSIVINDREAGASYKVCSQGPP